METITEFSMMAVAIGRVQGGVQSLSRSLYPWLIPAEKSAEFFGFYIMPGKFAAVISPLLMGLTGMLTGQSPAFHSNHCLPIYRWKAHFSCLVNEKEETRLARQME
jgi:MFS-type transporter involved in bile tolerance (Atg22 family)